MEKVIYLAIKHKLLTALMVLGIIGWGIWGFTRIPIDAVPDITNNQVQIITQTPTLAAQEVEQFITFPIEVAMANLPDVVEIRSISRFGISAVTVVFEESVDVYLARQLISEQLKVAESEIPEAYGRPELAPLTTGLGEVYQYILHPAEGYEDQYSAMDLRTINDWIVTRQLAGTPGVIEVSGWGGFLKQYEVAVDPEVLKSMNITIAEVYTAIKLNNENTGGSYIEKRFNTYFIRSEGLVQSIEDIEKIVVKNVGNSPVLVGDIAKVGFGSAPRFGAVTYNGKGEVVGGQALMLKGANSFDVVQAVKKKIEIVRASLPEGVVLEAFMDRSELIGRAIGTVAENLIIGGLIVIFILVILLGNFRGGLIVASTIPLSMLFALGMMSIFNVSANLMSLGALDFGIIVDGAVIIVENVVYYLTINLKPGQKLTAGKMDTITNQSSAKMMSSAFFGQLIILLVFLPILSLEGIEGKMFKPMAQTVSFAMIGAILLSFTYIPMMTAMFLKGKRTDKPNFADRLVGVLHKSFDPVLRFALRYKVLVLVVAGLLFGMSIAVFNRLGGEFIPTLEEGDFALHQILPPGSSLAQSVEISETLQNLLMDNFPEIEKIVTKIGSSEIPTDPMPIEVGDIMVIMKPKSQWTSAKTKDEMFEKMEQVMSVVPGVGYEFTQPIQMRFNEMMTGIREDIAIKIFGDNLEVLSRKGKEAESLIKSVEGIGDARVEVVTGLPQIVVQYKRDKIAQYGLNISEVNLTLKTAFAGLKAGVVFENERKFDLVVRLATAHRQSLEDVRQLFISLPNGKQVPLKEVADIVLKEGPMQISRENTKRRITVGVNTRGRDIESVVGDIRDRLETSLKLPPGYYIEYGGAFENLKNAKERLAIVVPLALGLIFILIFLALRSFGQTLLIYLSIPLAAMGGVYSLWLRGMPFSISAGVGFIVLSGVAVLNGLVLISSLNDLKSETDLDWVERIIRGTKRRIRPILLTASTDILGFLPMALSDSAGAEVQRPLATVVIGGLITATLLTLIVLPVLYSIFDPIRQKISTPSGVVGVLLAGLLLFGGIHAASAQGLTIDQAVALAKQNHPEMKGAQLQVEQQRLLKKTAFDPGATRLSYSIGQLNAPVTDYQLEVSQQFKFPTAYGKQQQLHASAVGLSEAELQVTSASLEHAVRTAYMEWVVKAQVLESINLLANKYSAFATVAAKRFAVGEINRLEKMTAESRFGEVSLQQQQAAADVNMAREHLMHWINTKEAPQLPASPELKLVYASTAADVSKNPGIHYQQQAIEVAAQQQKVAGTGYLPELSAGYVNQQIEGTPGLSAVRVGIAIPLFYGAQKGRVQAAKIGVKIAQSELEVEELTLHAKLAERLAEFEKYRNAIDYYESKGLKTSEELLRFAEKSYRAGEIGYVEYIRIADEASAIQTRYYEALMEYNHAVIDLQYLTGGFE